MKSRDGDASFEMAAMGGLAAGSSAGGLRAPGGDVQGATHAHEQQVRARLRQWIADHAKGSQKVGDVDDQTPLLESGLLSSLDIVELVVFIEELREEEVDTDAIEPEVFTSIDTMVEGFFADRV